MVTPYLEQLIHEGLASYKTFCVGIGGVATIPCPEKSRLVITDFIWSPFNDKLQGPESELPTLPGAQDYATHNMKLRIGNQMNAETHGFVLRDPFTFIRPFPAEPACYYFLNNHVQHHVYIAADQPVQIDIYNYEPVRNWTVTMGAPPPTANEPNSPEGYGTEGVVLQAITSSFYVPMGLKRAPLSSGGPGTRTKDQMIDDVNPVTALSDPTTNKNPYGFPVVTFGYVLISKTSSTKFRT